MSEPQRKNWSVLGWDGARWNGEKIALLSDEMGWAEWLSKDCGHSVGFFEKNLGRHALSLSGRSM
ncbi:MAG: hypothetical protein QNK92_00695 [Amylibacter sp.]